MFNKLMKVISLSYDEAGYACSIGTSIKNKYNTITNFFDYLVVDMKTINDIVNLKDLNLIMNNLNIEDLNDNKHIKITWNNFYKLISYHDLNVNYNENDIEMFKNKYIRRFHRLMNDIYNEKIIYFLRYGKTSYNEVNNFINIIKKINSNLIVYFINVDYDENISQNIVYENIENYIYINFHSINENKNYNEDLYYRILEYNWDFVFDLIEKNNKYFNNR